MHEIVQLTLILTGMGYIVAILIACSWGAWQEDNLIEGLKMISIWGVGPIALNFVMAYAWVNLL